MASALALKGVQMGPLLLTNQPEYLSATFITMIITNILMVIVAIGIAKVFAQILAVPYYYLGPIILLLAIIGSFSEGNFVGVSVMVIEVSWALLSSICISTVRPLFWDWFWAACVNHTLPVPSRARIL